MSLQTSEISADLSAAVEGLDLNNELFGSTEGDDGIDMLASKTNSTESNTKTTDTTDAPAVVVATSGTSKADIARAIFNREYPRVVKGETRRCDVIRLFESEAGLTKAGAGTYYQNFFDKAKKAAAMTATTSE